MLRNTYRRLEQQLRKGEEKLHVAKTWVGEVAMIRSRAPEHRSVKLSPEQSKELDTIWGAGTSKRRRFEKWTRLYYKRSGTFAPDYMPEIVYSTRVEPRLVNYRRCEILGDKALTEILFSGVEGLTIPETVLVRSNGFYYGPERKPMTKKDALSILHDAGRVFMKPSVGSAAGEGVRSLDLKGGLDQRSGSSVAEVLGSAPPDFIVQRAIVQNEKYACLHPASINTVRVVTYVLDGKVHHWPSAMRMGVGGNAVDNAHAGGIFVGVEDDGALLPWAMNMEGDHFKEHPTTRVRFAGHFVPGVPAMLAAAYRLHGRLPGIGIVSWDFAYSDQGAPVLVESNLGGAAAWLPQMTHGKGAFGKNTKRVLQLAGMSD